MMDACWRDILSLERAENWKFVKADIFERPVSFSVERDVYKRQSIEIAIEIACGF